MNTHTYRQTHSLHGEPQHPDEMDMTLDTQDTDTHPPTHPPTLTLAGGVLGPALALALALAVRALFEPFPLFDDLRR
jgi:hypothetical protein